MASFKDTLGNTFTISSRPIVGSDLSTVAADLNASHIPLSSTDQTTYSSTTVSGALAHIVAQATQGPRGYGIDSIVQNGSQFTVTWGNNAYHQTLNLPAGQVGNTGPAGDNGTSVTNISQLGSEQVRFVTTDHSGTTTNYDLTMPSITGPAGKGVSSVSLGNGSQNPTATYGLTFQFTDNTSTEVTFAKPSNGTDGADGADGADGKEVTTVGIATNPSNNSEYALTFTYNDSSTHVATFSKPVGGPGPAGVSVTDVNQVNATTINFNLSNNTTTSNITLPSSTATDLLPSYSGNSNKVLALNSNASGLAWVLPSGTGTVTSIGVTGSNGITVTGSPVTTSGSIGVSLSLGANLTYNTSTQQIDATDTDTTYSVATTSADGLLSSTDKSKLDGIAVSANNYALPIAAANSLGGIKVGANLTINNSTGVLDATDTDTTYSAATTSADGLMSSTDKSKLDGIATNANNYALPIATANDLGGFKVGTNLTINSTTGVLDATDTNTTYSVVTTSADGLMSSTDKTKLDGVAASANNYSLPIATANALGGFKVGTNLTINSTTGVLDATDTNTTYSVATTSADGLMSSSDKTKLDSVATSANNYSLPTASSSVLGGIKVGANLSITNGVLDATDTDTTYSVATTSVNGLMSGTDKTKLDGIAANANNYSLPIASASALGGFKVGTNLSIDASTGVLSATGGGGSTVDPVVMALALG